MLVLQEERKAILRKTTVRKRKTRKKVRLLQGLKVARKVERVLGRVPVPLGKASSNPGKPKGSPKAKPKGRGKGGKKGARAAEYTGEEEEHEGGEEEIEPEADESEWSEAGDEPIRLAPFLFLPRFESD